MLNKDNIQRRNAIFGKAILIPNYKPLSNLKITALGFWKKEKYTATTASDGSFSFEDLTPDRYILSSEMDKKTKLTKIVEGNANKLNSPISFFSTQIFAINRMFKLSTRVEDYFLNGIRVEGLTHSEQTLIYHERTKDTSAKKSKK